MTPADLSSSDSTSVVSANTPPMSSTMVNKADSPDTPCSTGLEDRIAKRSKDFDDLVNSIEDSFITNGVSLVDLKKSIKNIPVSLKRDLGDYFRDKTEQILNARSIKSLFVFLSYHWDYLNPGLLKCIVIDKRFGSDVDKQLMTAYLKKLEQFRCCVKLGEYVKHEHSFVDVSACHYQEIITTMGPGWEEKNLQDAESFKK